MGPKEDADDVERCFFSYFLANIVTTSKAPVTTSVALVPSSYLIV